ncbi:SagB family peptide dehydrogenase [Sphingomonas sp.]|jgi:SagB-type dehydrogenase family enzyme|uniref:SagB family peptide dehydrogenase n=1 Tax=Sphingomonas sp. TaxID=28214 RepID=UPI002E3795B8|nr:SagB family peptide dehydrogenase [Sphingomonas sp.]HEX4694650.1 SagB family peptide dehydrogenase [Sphingomonas sp.]
MTTPEHDIWLKVRLPSAAEESAWELLHENSKVGKYYDILPDDLATARSREMHPTLRYARNLAIALPQAAAQLGMDVAAAITQRRTPSDIEGAPLAMETLATLLRLGYGQLPPDGSEPGARPRRTVPSGGALYPLELYVYVASVEGMAAGLYHFDPLRGELAVVRLGDASEAIAAALVQPALAQDCSAMVFVAALFERSTFKYGDRGYRAVLVEAGHVGQNLALTATALRLGCINLFGYHDRAIDGLLAFDGLTASVVYMAAIGHLAGHNADPR